MVSTARVCNFVNVPLVLLVFAVFAIRCSDTERKGDGDSDGDSDGDVDAEHDGDGDVDAEHDGDTEGDADEDDSAADADVPIDTDVDSTTDADADGGDDILDRWLFIGNSYTASYGLNSQVAGLLTELGYHPYAEAVTGGGMTLAAHADDADGTHGDTYLRQLLVTGPEAALGWDLVVLQGQSQIAGFDWTDPEWLSMVDGAITLHDFATATGANTVLLMTWGRRDGDSMYPDIYPDYLTMQDRLADGYTELARRLSAGGMRVVVAPAGEAFRIIYLDGDLAEFESLYAIDGSHPSEAGSYLAACVIIATVTGSSPVGLISAPASLDASTRLRLQEVAAQTVLDPSAPALWRL